MKMGVARHSRARSQLPGPWSAFADMEWPACSPAGNRIFPSFFARRVFLVRPRAGRETFIARNFLRFMTSLPGRRWKMRVAIYARVSSERQQKKHTIGSPLAALRNYGAQTEMQIADEF